jgi:hypothetical protein
MYTVEELTPANTREEMFVMAILRKCRGQEIDYTSASGMLFKSSESTSVSLNAVYSKPATKKLDINWDFVNPKFNYAAIDDGGRVFFYELKPNFLTSIWVSDGGEVVHADLLHIDTTDIDWKDSLTHRPS